MTALALMIRPTDHGWGIYLTNGEELVQYRGFFAKPLALRYLQRYTRATLRPRSSLRSDFWRWRRD